MYDLMVVALLFVVPHLAMTYVMVEVLRLEYQVYLAASVAIGLVMALIIKAMAFVWKEKIGAAVRAEEQDHTLLPDVLLFFGIMIVGGLLNSLLVYRRFGAAGWAGALVANWLASWLV
jgi:hypothetical protein